MKSFDSENELMEAAIVEAKSSIGIFFENFAEPKPGQKSFLLKVAVDAQDSIEHIWLADLDFASRPLSGTVANETNLPGVGFMDRLSFEPPQISDWMFIENGYLVGGFTMRLIRSQMSPLEREEFDKGLPYKIKD